MTDQSTTFQAIKKIGTKGNYLRLTEANAYLLQNPKFTEVTVTSVDGKLVEEGSSLGDITASKDLGRLVAEIEVLDKKRAVLVATAAALRGGKAVLADHGIEVPEQSIHDTPAGRSAANAEKEADKRKRLTEERNDARSEKRDEALGRPATPQPVVEQTTPNPENSGDNGTEEEDDI